MRRHLVGQLMDTGKPPPTPHHYDRYVSLSAHVLVPVSVHCLCVYLSAFGCVSLRAYVCTSAYVCVCLYVCVCVSLSLSMSTCLFAALIAHAKSVNLNSNLLSSVFK